MFPQKYDSGTPYIVTVSSQPDGKICQVFNDTGIFQHENVTAVKVVCRPNI